MIDLARHDGYRASHGLRAFTSTKLTSEACEHASTRDGLRFDRSRDALLAQSEIAEEDRFDLPETEEDSD